MSIKQVDYDVELDSLLDPQESEYVSKFRTPEQYLAIFEATLYNNSFNNSVVSYLGFQNWFKAYFNTTSALAFGVQFEDMDSASGSISYFFAYDAAFSSSTSIYFNLKDAADNTRTYIFVSSSGFRYKIGAGFYAISAWPAPAHDTIYHLKITWVASTNTYTYYLNGVPAVIPPYGATGAGNNIDKAYLGVTSYQIGGFYWDGIMRVDSGASNFYENVPYGQCVTGTVLEDVEIGTDLDSLSDWTEFYSSGTYAYITSYAGMFRPFYVKGPGTGYNHESLEYALPVGHTQTFELEFWVYMEGTIAADVWGVYLQASHGNTTGFYYSTADKIIKVNNVDNTISGGYALNTPIHYRMKVDYGSRFQFWENDELILSTTIASITFDQITFRVSDEANLYVSGFGIVGYDDYKQGDNYFLKGVAFAQNFIERSAKLKRKGIELYEHVDIDGKISHNQFPPEVQRQGGLSLGHQIRWLQQNMQESNLYYLIYMDTIRAKIQNQKKKLDKLWQKRN